MILMSVNFLGAITRMSRIKNGLLSIAALMLDYNDIVVMCLKLIPLRIVSWQHNGAEKNN